jgi:hypothetical protein
MAVMVLDPDQAATAVAQTLLADQAATAEQTAQVVTAAI